MSTTKYTKHAFIMSILSLLICVAMLIGTTFAWFTDTVSTGRNTIVAGNLDVELYARNAETGAYEPVDDETELFSNVLWEPNHTEIAYLKVCNAGSLALKYKLEVSVNNEVLGENSDGEPIRLSDFLVFKAVHSNVEPTYNMDREEAQNAAGNEMGLNNDNLDVPESILYPTTAEDMISEEYVTIIVYMPYYVGNEANYTGTTPPSIDLGVNLVATQASYEDDSFGSDYDVNASYATSVATAEELKDAIANGENVALTEDITIDDGAVVVTEGDITINLVGHELEFSNPGTYALAVTGSGKLTINNGNVTTDGGYAVCSTNGGTLNLNKVTVNGGSVAVWASTLNINGGSITTTGNTDGVTVNDGTNAKINGTAINAGRIGVASHGSNNTLVVNNANIESNYFGIYHNGSNAPANITVTNSTINNAHDTGTGIYVSNSASAEKHTVRIEGCEITGDTAIEIKYSNATITDCTLTATCDYGYIPSGNGACTNGCGIAISSNNGGATSGEVHISGNTYESVAADHNVVVTVEGASVDCDVDVITLSNN